MNIAITGSAGLIGSYLREHLKAAGHHVMPIIRTGTPMRKGGIFWDPESGWLDMDPMVRYDAVIHLAGENIAHRWTGEKKIDIYHSRVDATRLLCKTLAIFPPKLFICASAVGFYGDCDDFVLDETHPPGEGFLANLCVDWEAAAHEIADHSRVVSLRFGMVLSKKGGVLKKMIGVFRLGTGGPLGDGQQYYSWVAIEDAVRAIEFIIENQNISGAVNIASPEAATNELFTTTLARALKRPAIMHIPEAMLRMTYGQFATEVLLASTRAYPQKLLEHGFEFKHPHLKAALEEILKAPKKANADNRRKVTL